MRRSRKRPLEFKEIMLESKLEESAEINARNTEQVVKS